jgi:hypothetical protein
VHASCSQGVLLFRREPHLILIAVVSAHGRTLLVRAGSVGLLVMRSALNLHALFGEVFRTLLYMGSFGGDSLKPLFFWSNTEFARRLWRPRMKVHPAARGKTAVSFRDKKGIKRCTGIPAALKHSQSYPPAFGAAMGQLVKELKWEKPQITLLHEAAEISESTTLKGLLFDAPLGDYWEDVAASAVGSCKPVLRA